MSEETKDVKRKPYTLNLEDHFPFKELYSGNFITSAELCEMCNDVFGQLFADFQGCNFEMGNNRQPSLSMVFDHADHSGSSLPVACSRLSEEKVGNKIIDSTRNYDRQYKSGDRYYITEDGKDIFTPLLLPRLVSRGKINWNQLVVDFVDGPIHNQFMPPTQNPNLIPMTKISGISPDAVCSMLYGNKEEGTDEYVQYSMIVLQGTAPVQNSYNYMPKYMLMVIRANENNIVEVNNKLGLGMGSTFYRKRS